MPNPVTVVLKDENNNDHTHTTQKGVRLNKQGGGTQDFYLTEGTALLTDTTSVDVRDKANAQIDTANISGLDANNIKTGATILGVAGSYAGIIPSGKKLITDENETDVTSYATAQIDTANVANLSAGNIKKDVSILGVIGDYEGGGMDPEKSVKFYDYDGTLVYEYTKEEFLALSSMPSNPVHAGLTSQGWNWSFSNAQSYVYTYGRLIIGQIYVPSDGKTRANIVVDNTTKDFILRFAIESSATGTVSWGDGSADWTITPGTTNVATHSYATAGEYVIVFNVSSGKITEFFSSASGSPMYADRPSRACVEKIFIGSDLQCSGTYGYQLYNLKEITYPIGTQKLISARETKLKCVIVPDGVSSVQEQAFAYIYGLNVVSLPRSITRIDEDAFSNCSGLNEITIPDSNVRIDYQAFTTSAIEKITIPEGSIFTYAQGAFRNCKNLKYITLPSFSGTLPSQLFRDCSGLVEITIPNGITTIESSACASCFSLKRVIIPATVTSIQGYAFSANRSVSEYHILSENPPTITSNTFYSIAPTTKFYVSSTAVNTYKSAQYWSDCASQIFAEPS